MYEHQPNHTEQRREPPAIYLASLADYAEGRLHGVWLDATQEPTELWEAANAMLAASPTVDAEEIAIHDHSGFAAWHPDEFTELETAHQVAAGMVEHGPAFAAWADYVGATVEDLTERFLEAYRGEWPSLHDYAVELVTELGVRISVEPESWRRYVSFDTAALARDLEYDLHVADSPDGTVYLFDARS